MIELCLKQILRIIFNKYQLIEMEASPCQCKNQSPPFTAVYSHLQMIILFEEQIHNEQNPRLRHSQTDKSNKQS